MARINEAYGFTNPLQRLNPLNIVSQRAPTANDRNYELGQMWIDVPNQAVYVLTAIVAGVPTWSTSPASGATTLASLIVNAGDIHITATPGNLIIDQGDLTLSNGNASIAGNLTVTGNLAVTGDFDITDTASISLTSTNNAARAIYLHANGGVLETIELHSDQGTAVNSVFLNSDVGGITLSAGLATADAINLAAGNGGIDMDSALQTNITSSQAAVDALRLLASNAAGGIDIDAGTGGITIDSTGAFSIDGAAASNVTTTGAGIDLTLSSVLGSVLVESTENAALAIRLHANGGTSETIQLHSDLGTGVGSINLLSDAGGLTFRATGLASADAINLEAAAGGIDVDAALQINIASSQAAVADSIRIVASAADGGIDIDAGTGGITIDSTGAFSLDGAAASNVTTTGAGIDLTLSSVLGSVLVSSTEDAALAIRLHANGGTSETIQLHSDQGTGVGSVNLLSDVGGLTLRATGLASADAINLEAPAGGIDVDAALQINVASSQAAATAIQLTASAGTGGITMTAGSGGINLASAGIVTMAAVADTQASPSATSIINANVGAATFTGFTTAAAAAQVFIITNSLVSATSQIFVSAANEGANDAQMTVTRVNRGAGTFSVTLTNHGAAALNGNVTITFWVLA